MRNNKKKIVRKNNKRATAKNTRDGFVMSDGSVVQVYKKRQSSERAVSNPSR